MHKRSSSSDGFSLIEVLVSLVLLVIGVLGMASLTGTVMEGNRSVTNYTRAAETLREKVEEMQSVPIRGVISGADVDSVGGVELDGHRQQSGAGPSARQSDGQLGRSPGTAHGPNGDGPRALLSSSRLVP
jgi:prepilin-type N-terminal cleavage/methylation domain-containing protein